MDNFPSRRLPQVTARSRIFLRQRVLTPNITSNRFVLHLHRRLHLLVAVEKLNVDLPF